MPKAENRKRPPNFQGNAPGRDKHNKSGGVINTPEQQRVQDKKQELLDKMKKIQQGKKGEQGNAD